MSPSSPSSPSPSSNRIYLVRPLSLSTTTSPVSLTATYPRLLEPSLRLHPSLGSPTDHLNSRLAWTTDKEVAISRATHHPEARENEEAGSHKVLEEEILMSEVQGPPVPDAAADSDKSMSDGSLSNVTIGSDDLYPVAEWSGSVEECDAVAVIKMIQSIYGWPDDIPAALHTRLYEMEINRHACEAALSAPADHERERLKEIVARKEDTDEMLSKEELEAEEKAGMARLEALLRQILRGRRDGNALKSKVFKCFETTDLDGEVRSAALCAFARTRCSCDVDLGSGMVVDTTSSPIDLIQHNFENLKLDKKAIGPRAFKNSKVLPVPLALDAGYKPFRNLLARSEPAEPFAERDAILQHLGQRAKEPRSRPINYHAIVDTSHRGLTDGEKDVIVGAGTMILRISDGAVWVDDEKTSGFVFAPEFVWSRMRGGFRTNQIIEHAQEMGAVQVLVPAAGAVIGDGSRDVALVYAGRYQVTDLRHLHAEDLKVPKEMNMWSAFSAMALGLGETSDAGVHVPRDAILSLYPDGIPRMGAFGLQYIGFDVEVGAALEERWAARVLDTV
ncbi:hypothetical protein MKEN_01100500 [Mycena kentingensis (nom. inval.)]|nr:hypothetical protein MKEN_01100500 [Mycena kentingensis (nom. inval.)]